MEKSSALLRGVQVLLCLAEAGGPVTVTDLAATLGIPTSTAHRILKILKTARYAEQDSSSRYRIGSGFFRPTTTLVSLCAFHVDLQRVQQRLVKDSGESAFYGAYLSEAGRMRFIATLNSHKAIRYVMQTDVDYSLLWGASGLSIASALPEPILRRIYLRERDSGEGERPLPDWPEMIGLLRCTRQTGFAISDGQRSAGAHAIAAPVFTGPDTVIGCIGLSLPDFRRHHDATLKYAALVQTAASDLSVAAEAAFQDAGSAARKDVFSQLSG